jgi:hypothetical protein
VPARWLLQASKDMLAQKLVTLASTILLLQWMETLPTQGIYKEAPLAIRLHTNYSCPFCHTDFINQEKVIEQTQTQNLTCWNLSVLTVSKSLIYDKIDNYIAIQIMTYIRILPNLPQQCQQPGRVNWSHEHISMNRLETSNT